MRGDARGQRQRLLPNLGAATRGLAQVSEIRCQPVGEVDGRTGESASRAARRNLGMGFSWALTAGVARAPAPQGAQPQRRAAECSGHHQQSLRPSSHRAATPVLPAPRPAR